MKNRARRRTVALALLLALVLIIGAAAVLTRGERDLPIQEGNLLQNGDFSAVTDGMPDGWSTGMWVTSVGASYLEAVTLEDGTSAVLVENAAANDARFEQSVAVRENATYLLTARVRAEGCDESELGANVSFLGIYGTSRDVHDTDGEWETVSLYARTGKGQKEATVCVRLGGYGSETTGRAWFTDVSLTQVDSVPVGESVLDLATPEPQQAETASAGAQGLVIPGLLAVGALYLAASAAIALVLLRVARGPGSGIRSNRMGLPALGGMLALALLVRLGLAAGIEGYGVDMGCFSAWAGKMASGGPVNFYEEGYFCDYPPAYMLVLGALGALANLLGIPLGGMGMQMMLKLVPIACDMVLAVLVFRATDRVAGRRGALGMAALMAFNPAFVITGSCWGQIDSVLAVLLVLMLTAAREGRWQAAIPIFAVAVLAKPQAGLLAPLGVAALIKDIAGRQRRQAGRNIGLGLLFGAAVTAVIVLPFSLRQDSALWIVDKYVETLSSYDYATLSTGNLMFLLGGNWVKNGEAVIASLSYGQLGMALMVVSFAAGIAVYLRGEGRKRLFLSSAVTMQLVFVLGTKMHERYILPALALLLLAYLETGNVRLLISCVLSSAASAVNIGVVLAFEYLIAPNLWVGYLIGTAQLMAAALTVWASVCLTLGHSPMRLPAKRDMRAAEERPEDAGMQTAAEKRMRDELLHAQDYRLHLRRRDIAIMLLLTAAYAVVGFWNLGAVSAPQTGYASTAAGESVVIDLGDVHEDFHIYYYGGISDTQFSFAVSDDGVSYTEETDAFFDRGECFKWLAMRTPTHDDSGTVTGASGGMLSFSGRYLRVTFKGAGAALWEVAAVDGGGQVILPESAESFGALEGRGSDARLLIDEQDTVPDVPGYLNSMYFDEIYHARTGYEHANALYTYETTHPPLGKVFMSWCIRLMGMTPFAWRFAGALCGVLMIPAIYLLAMQLFSRTRYAALCAFLLAADCMHFTQTRIATIDSFPVLFMMVMFLFMARWMKMSFYHQRLRDTFVPLALSGAFMGLAIASKWIGCYGAVGLALLFFSRFFVLWRQSVYAAKHREEDPAFARAADLFARRGAQTIAACVVFFVVVPVVIYVLSYIPYLRAYGEIKWNLRTFERIWDAQVLMFEYHKNLVATHYFASPWYEWPLIIKPMWYYAADYKGAGMASSILAFGNPALWWTGLAGILFVLGYSAYRNALPAMRVLPGRDDPYDRAMPVIAVGFLSAYLPWVLVTRLTFIYHYFASVPFIILATAQALRYVERRRPRLAGVLMTALCAAALVLFIAFYPLASGLEVPRAWCDAVSWFKNWMWY
ncbi:MAG: phospholipid carrier-dependent glycosyltransferase [Clostridia bacterium]|nr:phospholipid carrier-dependent glycosyltransferase [Clostridia bacterium]